MRVYRTTIYIVLEGVHRGKNGAASISLKDLKEIVFHRSFPQETKNSLLSTEI
jgi:hypothetical protein